MPTERFMRLPEAKKRAIWKAAFDEFSRTKMDKVSINRIIQEAEISRGSFYTYFEDKWDLLDYLLGTMQMSIQNSAAVKRVIKHADIWEWLDGLFEGILEFFRVPENLEFIRNFCSSVGTADVILKDGHFSPKYFNGKEREFDEEFDKAYQRSARDGGLISLTCREMDTFKEFCKFSLGKAVTDAIKGTEEGEIKRDFAVRMNFLRRSVERKKGDIS
jgi:AcrR family transcriptional regulator